MKVCLDAGHGYKGTRPTGAAANGLIEDDIALDFVTRVGHFIRKGGGETVLTRPTGTFVTLGSRGALAVKNGCDMFISFHCNAAGSASARGAEIFVAYGDYNGKRKAEALLERICAGGALTSRGVKWDNQSQHSSLRVLRDTYKHMPAMLIEMGFLTNERDAAFLKSKTWREAISEKIAQKILELGANK